MLHYKQAKSNKSPVAYPCLQEKKEVKYIVSKKFQGQTRVPKFKGNVKLKVVDPRMKKDLRAAKSKEKTKSRGRKGKAGG